jgi:uncharacterized CHY-type Zn-finger protein
MPKQQAEVQTDTLVNALIQHPNVQRALKEIIKELLVLGKIEKPLTADDFAMGKAKCGFCADRWKVVG